MGHEPVALLLGALCEDDPDGETAALVEAVGLGGETRQVLDAGKGMTRSGVGTGIMLLFAS